MAIIQRFSGVLGGVPVDNRTGITKVPCKDAESRNNIVSDESGKDSFDKVLEKYMNLNGTNSSASLRQ